MNLTEKMIDWLACGERGISSNTIFEHLTGHHLGCVGWRGSHPHDPDDLSRCRKLLEKCPELKELLPKMATRSPVWAALTPEWDSLCEEMDREAPNWNDGRGSAPITYGRMKKLINLAQEARETS